MNQAAWVRPKRHARVQAGGMQAHAGRTSGRRIACVALGRGHGNSAIWLASTAGPRPLCARPRSGNRPGSQAVRPHGRRQAPLQASRPPWRHERQGNGRSMDPARRCAPAGSRADVARSGPAYRCRYVQTGARRDAASGYLWPGIGAGARSWLPQLGRIRGARTAAQGTLVPAGGRVSS